MKPRIPTTQEIKDNIINNIEQDINQTTPLLAKAFNRVLATALAGAITLLYKFGSWVFDQIFTTTQDLESLRKEGEEIGVIYKDAIQAELVAEVTGIASSTLQAGTQFVNAANGLVYATLSAATILPTETTISVDVLCLTAGFAGNLADSTVISLISPLTNFNDDAVILSTTVLGSDAELPDDYRQRILQAKQRKPQGGAIADYVGWALEVADITRAFAFNTSPGTVTVYTLTDNLPARIPTAPKLAEVQAYLEDPIRKPLNDTVIAGLFTEVEFDVTITNLIPNTAEVKETIEENITQFLLEREPKQYDDQVNPKNIISESNLINVAIESGAESLDLLLEESAIPITSYILNDNEVAKLGSIVIS